MANLDEGLIKALQSIDANKEISDKFKSCSKENVYEMLRENGYNGSTQEFENLLSNIEKEIGDLLMQKKSDKDLSNVSGGKGANYFRKGLALGLTALSVGSTVQPGAFAAEVKQNANTKSFGEKAKEFFSKAKGKVSNFVDAHPGVTLLLALGATNVANSFITLGLAKRHYNKTQIEIKQEISGARAQLLATCKDVIGVDSGEYEKKLEAFETAVDKKVKEFKFDKDLKTADIAVGAVKEFEALFGNVSDGGNVFNALSTVERHSDNDLIEYIINIRNEIIGRLQNDPNSKLAKLTTKQLNFLNTVIGYAENVVVLKRAEHIEQVTSEVTGAKQTIISNLNSIQEIISKENETAFIDNDGTWRTGTGNEEKAKAYKAVVTEVRRSFENVLESVFGDLKTACKVGNIGKVVNSLKFFEENIISNDHKLAVLTGNLPAVEEKGDVKTVLTSEADKDTVNNLANAANLKAFVNVILAALKTVTVDDETSGLAAKFEVVKTQKEFSSSEEVGFIDEIAKLLTINGLEKYKNETTEFEDINAAKLALIGSNFVKTVDEWVKKLKEENQGENKIFAAEKLNGIENLTVRVNAIAGETALDKLAAEIDKAFNALINDVKNLFGDAENFNEGYKATGVYDKVAAKKQGIFADNYADGFKLADRNLFIEKKEEEKAFKVNNTELKKLINNGKTDLADSLENVEIGTGESSKLKKDSGGTTNGKICGNVDNLKKLLLAIVGNALYAKLTNAFDGFDDLKTVEITKESLDDKTQNGFSYKFFAKLNEFEDNSDKDIIAFKEWIKDGTGVELKEDGTGVSKSIWDLIKEANDAK